MGIAEIAAEVMTKLDAVRATLAGEVTGAGRRWTYRAGAAVNGGGES